MLEVDDAGPGMTAEEVERIFERFYTADPQRTPPGGAGLHLALVTAVPKAHAGKVTARSEPGRGATFALALPMTDEPLRLGDQLIAATWRRPDHANGPHRAARSHRDPGGGQLTVLVTMA